MMPHDDLFRIVMIVGAATFAPVGLYYFVKSGAFQEKVSHRDEGWFTLLTLRPLAAARVACVVAFMINPAWMAWSAVPAPLWLRWLGVAIGAVGAAIIIATFRSLGTNLTDTVEVRRDGALVTQGPYRWVRHPFYVGFALNFAADAIVTANWLIGLIGLLVLGLLLMRTEVEEQKLIERFGDDYRNYMQSTPRYIPKCRVNNNIAT